MAMPISQPMFHGEDPPLRKPGPQGWATRPPVAKTERPTGAAGLPHSRFDSIPDGVSPLIVPGTAHFALSAADGGCVMKKTS
jgi:hypothetical protein